MSGLKDQVSSERQAPPTFRRRDGVSFAPCMNPISTPLLLPPPSLRKLSLSSHLLRQRRPTGRRLLSTSTFLSSAEFQLSLQTLWLSLPVLYQIWYITPVNNFCTMRKLLFSPSMNVNCLPVISMNSA